MLTEETFSEFYSRTARSLWGYVYRVTGNASDADDIVQEAFCRLLGARTSDLGEEPLRRYLFRIAGNLLVDRWRRSARDQSVPSSSSYSTDAFRDVSMERNVARTFAQLKPQERAMLWLAYVEETDHREIGRSLGLSPGSVRVLLSRARARLRDLLNSVGIAGDTLK